MLIKPSEEMQEVKGIRGIECTVFEREEGFQIAFRVIENKCMWVIVHHLQECFALVDDRFSLTPGKRRRNESSDLYVLLF